MSAFDYDVIVIGSGAAGLSAAIEAAETGASVMVVEADDHLGGATRNSTGVVYAADTKTQAEAGVEDSADALYDYVLVLNQYAVRPDLIRMYADRSSGMVDWLTSLGCEFPANMLVHSDVSGVERGHTSKTFGLGISDVLINRAGVLGVETALGTRVDGLLMEDGRTVGIRSGETELRAPCVVIATGGFGNSPEMLAKWFPSAAYHGERTWAVHRDAPFILGDGITLGESVDAQITGYDRGLIQPTPCFDSRYVEAFLPPWIVAVNESGKRFMAEWDSYAVCGYLINEQPGRRCWAIFDRKTMVENGDDLSYADPYNSGLATSSWEEITIEREVEKGVVHKADTIREVAAMAGLDADAVEETIRVYNRDIEEFGEDRVFRKDGNGRPLSPVKEAPFYAVEVRPAIIGFTAAGLDVNADMQVLDTRGKVIEGLYAAGETLGCFHGKRYAGGGTSIGSAVIFGRHAGTVAGEQALAARSSEPAA
ncbi:flavocytochrome c [Novosphingobium marinum]|uniref:Fumarate reductase flavoprotein subunit n=1 Tax=Novosphingobium marinum TaxID=1514948 RepID=A0A7Y9XT36_9SPHN|nr:FAD-dependent oxidoreductase [Novosphingobium marinum]NYH94014.1 fumarate reductase flavoprotein subunit [Novosphingobium marinum]GGC18950.1 flavocytochrome c [Novosphingobium marinum]